MNDNKCEFCKGTGKEPGEGGCVWCFSTGTKEAQKLLTPPAEQRQGEPVACQVEFIQGETPRVVSWNDHPVGVYQLYTRPVQREPVAWVSPVQLSQVNAQYDQGFADGCAESKRLNDHADAGEVAHLGCEVAKWRGTAGRLTHERDKARAQLAEQEALLLKCRAWIEAARDGVLYPIARDFDGVVGRNAEGLGQETPGLLDALDAALSASAEPSPSVEIDERADFEAAWSQRLAELKIKHRGNEFYRVQPNDLYRWHNVQDAWEMWQARAAMERKS